MNSASSISEYQATDDLRTLMKAQEICNDPKRLAACEAHAKGQHAHLVEARGMMARHMRQSGEKPGEKSGAKPSGRVPGTPLKNQAPAPDQSVVAKTRGTY